MCSCVLHFRHYTYFCVINALKTIVSTNVICVWNSEPSMQEYILEIFHFHSNEFSTGKSIYILELMV